MRTKASWMLAALCTAAWALSGCGNTGAETTINADGTWKRKVELRAPHPSDKPGEGMSMTPNMSLQDLFVAPQGAPWTVKKTRDGDEDVLTVERSARAPEELSGDLVLKSDPKLGVAGPKVTNRVAVKQLAPGRWEYRETLHWTGKREGGFSVPSDMGPDAKEFAGWVKGALPERLATPANISRFTEQFAYSFLQELLGPPDPLFDQIMFSPGAARFRFTTHIGPVVSKALAQTFGDQMTTAERETAVRKMVAQAADSMMAHRDKMQASGPPTGGKSGDEGPAPVFMSFSVHMPGRIVETNGLRQDDGSTVMWGMYSWSAMVRDVELRAVCETGKQ